MSDANYWEASEPALDDLLSDPIMEYLLRRDGLTRRDVWRAVETARSNLHLEPAVADAAA